jgi:hypothetical protein
VGLEFEPPSGHHIIEETTDALLGGKGFQMKMDYG